MSLVRVATIGGYGHDEGSFVRALRDAKIEMLVDVRQRRGVRGARYAFLNSVRLQALLAAADIGYLHASSLAPTSEVRSAQKAADAAGGLRKRDRTCLAEEFVTAYKASVLAEFEAADLLSLVGPVSSIALFCVEEHPLACHRSLAAEALRDRIGVPVEHLRACKSSSSR